MRQKTRLQREDRVQDREEPGLPGVLPPSLWASVPAAATPGSQSGGSKHPPENIPRCPWCWDLPPVPSKVSPSPEPPAGCLAQRTSASGRTRAIFAPEQLLSSNPCQAHHSLCLLVSRGCQGSSLSRWDSGGGCREGTLLQEFPSPHPHPHDLPWPWAQSGYVKAAKLPSLGSFCCS